MTKRPKGRGALKNWCPRACSCRPMCEEKVAFRPMKPRPYRSSQACSTPWIERQASPHKPSDHRSASPVANPSQPSPPPAAPPPPSPWATSASSVAPRPTASPCSGIPFSHPKPPLSIALRRLASDPWICLLVRTMVSQLVKHERIETTVAKVLHLAFVRLFERALVVGGLDLYSRRCDC